MDDGNKVNETESGVGEEASDFSAQAQKESFLAGPSSKNSNPEGSGSYEDSRAAEIVHKVSDFWERNIFKTVGGAALAGNILHAPPTSPEHALGAIAASAALLGVAHFMDRREVAGKIRRGTLDESGHLPKY